MAGKASYGGGAPMERPRWQQASRQAGTGQQRAEHVGRARQSAAIRMWRGCAGRICRRTSVGRQSTGNARRRKERHVSGCGGVCEFSRHRFKLQRERERESSPLGFQLPLRVLDVYHAPGEVRSAIPYQLARLQPACARFQRGVPARRGFSASSSSSKTRSEIRTLL